MRLPDDIGVPTDAWYRLPLAEALDHASQYATLVEILSADDHSLLATTNRAAALACGLRLTVHGPFDDLETGSTRKRDRRFAMRTHRRHLEAAAEVGALTYVVHPDYDGRPRRRDARVVDALQQTFAELAEWQRELGLRIVVENMPGVGFSHFDSPGDLDLGELGFVLDAGHATMCGTLDDFLRDPRAELTHVHLHDNLGPAVARDPHLPLGRGIVDAGPVLRAARASRATVILEVLDEHSVIESIAHLERRGLLAEARAGGA